MQVICQVVSAIISKDQIALEYLTNGLLNTSAYAKSIKMEVEKTLLLKEVSLTSIITSLSRIKSANLNLIKTKPMTQPPYTRH
jgi:hypothetical protein